MKCERCGNEITFYRKNVPTYSIMRRQNNVVLCEECEKEIDRDIDTIMKRNNKYTPGEVLEAIGELDDEQIALLIHWVSIAYANTDVSSLIDKLFDQGEWSVNRIVSMLNDFSGNIIARMEDE